MRRYVRCRWGNQGFRDDLTGGIHNGDSRKAEARECAKIGPNSLAAASFFELNSFAKQYRITIPVIVDFG